MNSIPARRLVAQELARPRFGTPAELVSWMGAVQAQDPLATRWAVGARLHQKNPKDDSVRRALDEGSILRTHVFRWTWQLVTPKDIRWMLTLVGARLVGENAKRHRDLEIDRRLVARSQAVFEKALRHGDSLTRSELGEALASAGIHASGPRLAHLLALAELESVLCSGVRPGKHHTYALLDHRAPAHRTLSREASLKELALRYFRSRGPATVADFIWWSGLPAKEARSAVEACARRLETEVVQGRTYHFADERRKPKPGHTKLVPAFDEWLVAYRNRDAVLDPAQAKRLNAGGGLLAPSVIVEGRVIGIWRRELSRDSVTIRIDCFEPVSATTKRDIIGAAERYAAFLGLTPRTHFQRVIRETRGVKRYSAGVG